ncbi:hypothetical protein XA68_17196 [Ophiocordyceps unilateralis]|uniref:Uncharacterized protein n=1 Tax=Ophiocordyceps unilateralis TaxID=268505 RepID=A0A2A9P547_OPHUN|nr:hypothetical protein XA68_17196 [Ophiocordyceps unilateralis]
MSVTRRLATCGEADNDLVFLFTNTRAKSGKGPFCDEQQVSAAGVTIATVGVPWSWMGTHDLRGGSAHALLLHTHISVVYGHTDEPEAGQGGDDDVTTASAPQVRYEHS